MCHAAQMNWTSFPHKSRQHSPVPVVLVRHRSHTSPNDKVSPSIPCAGTCRLATPSLSQEPGKYCKRQRLPTHSRTHAAHHSKV